MKPSHRLAISLATFAALACPRTAAADVTKAQCIDANTKAQDLRRDGKLSDASEQLRLCSDPKCPTMVRTDCTRRLDEVEAAQPAIIFDAKDGSGRDLGAVKVTVDGHPLADRLEGTGLRVDPGEHVFTFTVQDQPPVTQTFVLKEGEGQRHERIVIGAPSAAASPVSGTSEAADTPAASDSGGAKRAAGWVVGGVGVAGVGLAVFFGVRTVLFNNKSMDETTKANDQTLSPSDQATFLSAAQSDHGSASTSQTVAIVSGAAGGVALGVGVFLLLTSGGAAKSPASAGTYVLPMWQPGSGGLVAGTVW